MCFSLDPFFYENFLGCCEQKRHKMLAGISQDVSQAHHKTLVGLKTAVAQDVSRRFSVGFLNRLYYHQNRSVINDSFFRSIKERLNFKVIY